VLGTRLSLAVDGGLLSLPDKGRIAVFAPRAGADLSSLPKDRVVVITCFKPDFDTFEGQGFACAVAPDGRYAASVICLPRAKPRARALVAQAVAVSDGVVIVDGAKTDGVESILKECRKRVDVSAPISKAHGKIFWFNPKPAFDDWTAQPQQIEGGYTTAPGVFSADGIDPGSAMLAQNLPDKLGAQVADLGGGWGYLSARALERDTIKVLHLVEADHAACECARLNAADPRLSIHWADATAWVAPAKLDTVIMNPPFHTDRAADPDLGRAFVVAAARMLAPSGHLWMVANRHLPYEDTLSQHFAAVEEVAGTTKYKILHATRPSRKAR